jgi:periodic tryptophan protein 1
LILNFDARTLPSSIDKPSPSRFTLSAHDGAVSSLDINPHLRGVIATGGTDKVVKVWNVTENDKGKRQISLVTSRDLSVVRIIFYDVELAKYSPSSRPGKNILDHMVA